MKKAIVIILTALALVGCDTGAGDNNTTNGNGIYTKALWGEWLRMDTGDKWYITNNAVTINDTDISMNAILTKQSNRVIEVTDGGRKYYLYASRTATASFTGVIVGDTSATGSVRAVGGGLGGIRVSVENLVNKANELIAHTDADGRFTADDVILGDAYKLTPQGGTSVTVIPTSDGDDIGVVTITSGVNFKTSLIPAQSSTDMTELYMNEVYEFEIEFENTGDEDCPAPSYAITMPSGISITKNWQGILGTIEPGKKKNVPIDVRCYGVAGDHEYKKINITIRDGMGKTWEDSVSLRFYKESMDFSIKAEKPVSGILISPDSKTYSFTNVTDGKVAMPWRVSGDYLVVFSGATIETETRYSLGIGVEADGDFGAFFDTASYESNDTEGAAVTLNAQKLMSYLYKNDIDYYRIPYGNFNLPPAPINVSVNSADAEVTISWTAVTGASSYNVYRSTSQTGTYTKVGVSLSSPYTDTVASVGTYYYKVSVVGVDGVESAHSTPVAIAVTGPAVPTNVSANSADAEVTVSWTAVTGANSYNVYRSDSQTGTYTKVGASASSPYTDTVTAMGIYYYKASAVSVSGFESVHSTSTAIAVTMRESDVTSLSETLSWLSANAVSSSYYTLLLGKDETIPRQGLSYSGMDITITLKGKGGEKIVSLEGTGSLFTVTSGVTLVLEDGVTLKGHSNNNYNSLVQVRGGNLVLKDGGTISGNTSGGGVDVLSGTFTMSGGEICGNTTSSGGGVHVSSGTFTMNGGKISGNSAENGGGVFVFTDGTFTMSGGEISGNTTSRSSGGGVYVSSNGTFTMSGGKIKSNIASSGGGVDVLSGTFMMSGGEISNNTAEDGGGVYASGTFTMSDGTISGNTASATYFNFGGGVRATGTFTMSGGEISGNTVSSSSAYGGGVSASGGTFTMSGGKISDNTATGGSSAYGGGVEMVNGTFTMSGGEISGNTASSYSFTKGGGVYVSSGTFTKQSDGIIYGSNASNALKNTATRGDNYGHAIYVDSPVKKRNTTAGVGVALDSEVSGSAGGWE
jgi:hypothetical protein